MAMTTLNLREPQAESKPATRHGSSRRSQRVVIDFPVTLFGKTQDGRIFAESTNTQTVSAHGALVILKKDVNTQSPALLGNPKTQMEVQCRVVHRKEIAKDKYEIGLEFSTPVPRFWGINFPPEDWNPAERKKATSPPKFDSPTTKG
jgi:PilZ domain-containing protein